VGAKGEKVYFMPFVPNSCSAAPHPSAAPTPTFRPRNPARVGLVALLALVAAVVLTGCIKVDMNLALHEDDTASGTVLFAIQDSVAQQLGTTPDALWTQVEQEITQDWPAGTVREPYASDGYTGSEMTIPAAPIAAFEDVTGQPLSIQRQGDEFFISGELDLNHLALEEGAQQQWIENMQAQISITCPGRIIEANGTVTGNTVSWTPTTDGLNQFSARCEAVADLAPTEIESPMDIAGTVVGPAVAAAEEGVPRWIPALGIAFVLGLAALAWALWRHSHRHEEEYLGLAQFDEAGREHFAEHEGYGEAEAHRVFPGGHPEYPVGHPEYPVGHPEYAVGHPEYPVGHSDPETHIDYEALNEFNVPLVDEDDDLPRL